MATGIMSRLDEIRGMMPQNNMPQNSAPMQPQSQPQRGMGESPQLMQDMAPEMMTDNRQRDMVNPQEDGAKLAEAIINRSGGNPQIALDIIESASQFIMSSIQGSTRTPMRAADGGEMMQYRDGGKISMSELNPGLKALAKNNKDVVEKITGKTVQDMAGGGPMMPMYNLGGDIEKIQKMQDGGETMKEMMRLRGY